MRKHPLRHRSLLLLPAIFALTACRGIQPASVVELPYEPDSGDIAVLCGALIDGLADEAQPDRLIVVRDGRIERVVSGRSDLPLDMPFLDLREHTCMPGMMNTHTHLAIFPDDAVDYTVYVRRSAQDHLDVTLTNARTTLLTGFTMARNVGDWYFDEIYEGRERIREGKAIGPRILTAGPYLTIPGGGGDLVFPELGLTEDVIPPRARAGVARGAEDFREKARRAVAGGADFLKVIASGAVFSTNTEPGAPEMTEEEIAAVVDVAREAGLPVAAHVHSALSAKQSIRAGATVLEHASLLDDEAIAMAAEHGVVLSMDVYNGDYTDTVGREQGYPEEFLRRNFDTTEAQRVVFDKALAAGITIVYGTDAGVLPHDMGGWQFPIMVERGMTPMQAIKSATSVPARVFGLSADTGAIEAGRYGDLIAVRGNPLEDMTLMRDVDVVIKGGLLFRLGEKSAAPLPGQRLVKPGEDLLRPTADR